MKACLFVVVLALESEGVVGGDWVAAAVGGLGEFSPGAVLADPGEVTVAAGELQGRAEVVGLEVIECRSLGSVLYWGYLFSDWLYGTLEL